MLRSDNAAAMMRPASASSALPKSVTCRAAVDVQCNKGDPQGHDTELLIENLCQYVHSTDRPA